MGSRNRYVCPCGYTCDVSGGPDVGMTSKTRTIVCAPCGMVADVTSMVMGDAMTWTRVKVACPTCGGAVRSWPRDRACPRCQSTMQIDPSVIIMWD